MSGCGKYTDFLQFVESCYTIRRRQWHPLQYCCPENPMDGGAWQAAVHGLAKSQTRLSDFTFTFHFHALEKEMANPLQCSCLENPMDGEAWQAAVHGVAQSRTRLKQLSSSSSIPLGSWSISIIASFILKNMCILPFLVHYGY